MGRILAIFHNTFLESVRQPVYGLVLAVGAAVITLTPLTAAQIYSFHAVSGLDRTAARMIADLGLATILLEGLVLAVFTSTSAVSREIEDHTAATVLSRSIGRGTFVLAKYLGVAASIAAATGVSVLILLLTIRSGGALNVRALIDWPLMTAVLATALGAVAFATWRNYHHSRPWVGSYTATQMSLVVVMFAAFSLFDQDGRFILDATAAGPGTLADLDVAAAAMLTLLAVLVVASVAVAASSRLGTLGNSGVTGAIFVLGLISEFLRGNLNDASGGAVGRTVGRIAGEVVYTALPNLEKFWVSEALTREIPIPASYVAATAGYAILYIAAALCIAGFLLETRDVH